MARNLPDWHSVYLEYTENSEPPTIFRKWVAVSAIASVLERKCFFEWERKIYPNMYIVLVGDPGTRKGTAMAPVLPLMRGAQAKLGPNSITLQALSKRLTQCEETKVVDGQFIQHCSMTIYNGELTTFLGYKNSELVAALCDWYDCPDDWKRETIGRGEETIHGLWVNLLGATTPELLALSVPREAVGSGLMSRIIFVYAEGKEKIVLDPRKTPELLELEEKLLEDLQRIKLLTGEFRVTSEFNEAIQDWYIEHNQKPIFTEPTLKAYLERRFTHLLKLCMIMNASRTDSMILDITDFERSRDLLVETEKNMPKVFGGIGHAKYAQFLPSIMRMIAARKETDFGEIMFHYIKDLNRDELMTILVGLEEAGMCKIKYEGNKIKIART